MEENKEAQAFWYLQEPHSNIGAISTYGISESLQIPQRLGVLLLAPIVAQSHAWNFSPPPDRYSHLGSIVELGHKIHQLSENSLLRPGIPLIVGMLLLKTLPLCLLLGMDCVETCTEI